MTNDSLNDVSRTVKIRMMRRRLLEPRLPYMKVTDVIWMLRNTTYDIDKLADALELTLKKRELL